MKALVLAGGSGTRLRPFSHTMPKQLVPVAGKPVLSHALDTIQRTGITDVGIVVGTRGREIRRAVGDGSDRGLDITLISQEKPLGLAHCVMVAREYLGDESFLMYLGDNVILDELGDFLGDFENGSADARILVSKVSDPREYGIADVDSAGRVLGLQEKPERPRRNLAIVGLYLFAPVIHSAVESIAPSRRGELEITDAIQELVDRGRSVQAHLFSGYWKDTGRVDDLLDSNRVLLEGIPSAIRGSVDARTEITGPVMVGENATVRASRLVGPLIIGAGSTVTGSRIGPFAAVGANCRIDGSAVENSIIMDDVKVNGVTGILRSIIGRESTLRPSSPACSANRIVVGDHSHIQVRAC